MAPRILIVDPNGQSAAATQKLLSKAGYEAASSSTFEDATRTLASAPPDLLVTAIRLGRFNGLHLALRARADHPDLPVLVVGDAGEGGFADDAVRFGARYASKTMDNRAFLDVVQDLLNGNRTHKT